MKKYILIFLFMFIFVPKIKAFDLSDMGSHTIVNTSGQNFDFKRQCTLSTSDIITSDYKSCHNTINSKTFNQDFNYIMVSSYVIMRYIHENRELVLPSTGSGSYYQYYAFNDTFNFQVGMYLTAGGVNYQCTSSDDGRHFICPNRENITDIVLQVYGAPFSSTSDYFQHYSLTLHTTSSIYLFNTIGKSTTDAIKEQTNTIKSEDMTGGNQSAQDFKDNSAFNDSTGIQSIIELPLNFINSLSSTCQPLQLTLPYLDYDFTIPCLGDLIRTKVPLLANVITIVVNGFIVYRILLGILDLVKSARNPDDDRIEVLEL